MFLVVASLTEQQHYMQLKQHTRDSIRVDDEVLQLLSISNDRGHMHTFNKWLKETEQSHLQDFP